jgi:hypothetical protein
VLGLGIAARAANAGIATTKTADGLTLHDLRGTAIALAV